MKWKLEGYDTFDGEYYPIGTLSVIDGRSTVDGAKPSYDTYAEVLKDARWQLAQLEKTQPTRTSGGQAGIQDRVYIVHPDGRRERVL